MLCVYPLFHLPTRQFGLKNEFSQHVGLIQLCNMTPVTTTFPVTLPLHPRGVTGEKKIEGDFFWVGHVLLVVYFQDKSYLPTKFPFTLQSYVRGQVLFPLDYYPYIMHNGPVLLFWVKDKTYPTAYLTCLPALSSSLPVRGGGNGKNSLEGSYLVPLPLHPDRGQGKPYM